MDRTKNRARKVGKYEVIGKVAQGGMGALYKARHPTLNRIVLLKRLTSGASAAPSNGSGGKRA